MIGEDVYGVAMLALLVAGLVWAWRQDNEGSEF